MNPRDYRGDDNMVAWIVIFSLITIWFIVGLKICCPKKKEERITYREWKKVEKIRNNDYKEFLKSEKCKIIEKVASIPYSE